MNLQHIGSHIPTPGLLAQQALTHGLPKGARLSAVAPPVNEAARLAVVARPEPASANRAELRAHALLAEDVYNDRASPPAGYRTANAQDLQALRLNPGVLEVGDLRARVYVTGSGADTRYTIAFRGTEGQGDWIANAQQGTGGDSLHYRQALVIGQRIKNSPLASRVDFTGHSLGGGLASAAAIASGRPADTFNAAGLHDTTIKQANGVRAGGAAGRVDAYYVSGEVLSALQDGGDRVAGGLLGGLLGAAVADAPSAYGTRHKLEAARPDGAGWLDGLNPVAKHGMDWVLSSLPR